MNPLTPWLDRAAPALAALAPLGPLLAAMALGLDALARPPAHDARSEVQRERFVVRTAYAGLIGALVAALGIAALALAHRGAATEVRLGHWFHAGDYGFALAFRLDALAAVTSLSSAVLLLATARFSSTYLHREPGFRRFFLLVCVFAAGEQTLVTAGSYDLLFAGWEAVGLTSVLLVGFFQNRAAPVRASLRVLVTYRLCDVGLLLASLWLHDGLHSTAFADVLPKTAGAHAGAPVPWTAVSLALAVAAMGKSALFPVGGWLPRAMEGPTASSAVFYGALSVHAGVYLLLRSTPLLDEAPLARAFLVAIGLLTAFTSTLSAKASADAKTSLAHATSAQVGLMVTCVGLGFTRIATAHLVAHTLLRYYQFLRTPSVLQDALVRRALLGVVEEPASHKSPSSLGWERFVFRLAVERFAVEAAFERWIARPMLRLSDRLATFERRRAGIDDELALDGAAPPIEEHSS